MPRTVSLDIGINGAFLTRRWEDPDNWMKLTRASGFRRHEFAREVLDPFFSGDREYQVQTARAVRDAARRYDVSIVDVYTGVATHRFHGLSHSNPSVRQRMVEWIEQCMDLCLEMGTDRIGGHWDAFSLEVLESPERTAEAWKRLVQVFRSLAETGKRKGMAALYQEQMYIPSEVPWTIAQAQRFLHEVNQDLDGCPVLLTLDVGHMAGMHYGSSGRDLDYRCWLREFGAFSEIIHLQQTTPDASHHWPFTAEMNQRGHITIPAILDALQESHCGAASHPLAGIVQPVLQHSLVAELIPGSTRTEPVLLREQAETAAYLRQYIPEGGLTWTFES